MKKILPILILLLTAAFALAADPTLKLTLDATGYCHLVPANIPTGTAYDIQLFPVDAGNSKVELTWIEAGRPKHKWFNLPLPSDGEPGPTPPVPPTPPIPPIPPVPPVPPTPPTPVVQKIQAIVIEETENSSQEFAQVRSSAAVRKFCASGGHEIFFLDRDSKDKNGNPPPGYAKWLLMAVGKPLPFIVITDAAGSKVLNGQGEACPTNESAMLAYLVRYGGVSPPAVPGKRLVPCDTCPSGFRWE